jgi:transposase
MTYPLKFRQHVLAVQKQENLSYAEAALRFHVGVASLVRWAKNPEPAKGRNKPATKIDRQRLEEDVNRYPDAYLYERATRLGVSANGIHYALKRLGITLKKRPSTIRRLTKRLGPFSSRPSAPTNKKDDR